ncbi:MAG: AIR synthase family protein [Eubacterium sp.]|nr:AIR synthase family protein [Eubacterium sp.]
MSDKYDDRVLDVGRVPEKVVNRAIIKQLRVKRPDVLIHVGVGEDVSAIEAGDSEAFVFTVDPMIAPVEDVGKLAFQIAANDVASSGAKMIGLLANIILPVGSTESDLKRIMRDIADLSEYYNVEVLGGYSEVSDAVLKPIVSVTGVGRTERDTLYATGNLSPGDELVVTKWIGLEGSAMLASERGDELREQLPPEIVEEAKDFSSLMNVMPESEIAMEVGFSAMHDVTEGGIFGALWEMAAASGVGLEVDLNKIPIRQETIEICEVYDINPYMLMSSGSMLIGTRNGNLLVDMLQSAGIHASVIGYVIEGADRIVRNGDEKRYLEPPGVDEVYKALRDRR